jgi:hypothetical protein
MTAQVRPSMVESRGSVALRRPPRWLVITVVLLVALVLTDAVTQALWPLLRNDDWPYILPVHTPGTIDNYLKNQREGRWLNYVAWLAVGQHSTPLWASLTYVAAYAAFVAGLWRLLWRADTRTPWPVQALVGLALFASVAWVRLLYWPGTLAPSAIVAAAGVWLLPLAARSRWRMAVWVLVVTVLSVLSYQPVAAVLFIAAVVHLRRAPWRELLLLAVGWVASYAIGVAVIYSLNWVAFGHFGLEIAAWRHPNPLHDLHDLGVNGARAVRALGGLLLESPVATLTAAVAAVAGLLHERLRPLVLRLTAGLAVVAGIGAGQTLLTGVVPPVRGELWIWLALVLPAVLLLRAPGPWARVGVGCLAVLAVVGVLTWRSDIGEHQDTRRQYDAIVHEATAPEPGGVRPPVVVYQDSRFSSTVAGQTMAGMLRMMIRTEVGQVPRWCRAAECREIASRSAEPGQGPVVRLPSFVAVVVPPPPSWMTGAS